MALAFLVTRPGDDGLQLVYKLKCNNYKALHMPMYNLVNLKLSNQIKINTEDELFFFSKRAVKSIVENCPGILGEIKNKCWAVGPATAKALHDSGATNVIVSQSPPYDSHGLIRLIEQKTLNVENAGRFLLFKQPDGLDLVSNYLRGLGALVEEVDVYEQNIIRYDEKDWENAAQYRAIIITSASSIKEIAKASGYVSNKIAFVVGSRLYDIASSLNIFSDVVMLPSANNIEILDLVTSFKDEVNECSGRKSS